MNNFNYIFQVKCREKLMGLVKYVPGLQVRKLDVDFDQEWT